MGSGSRAGTGGSRSPRGSGGGLKQRLESVRNILASDSKGILSFGSDVRLAVQSLVVDGRYPQEEGQGLCGSFILEMTLLESKCEFEVQQWTPS